MQRQEINDDRQLIDGMMKHAVDVMVTTGHVSDANQLIQVRWRETAQYTKRHDSHLKVKLFWSNPSLMNLVYQVHVA